MNNYFNIPQNVDEIEDEPFRPKTGSGKRQKQEAADRSFFNEVKRLCGHRSGSFSAKDTGRSKGRSGLQFFQSQANCQRVLVKCRVVKIRGNGKKLIGKHINYITRSGVEIDGKPAMAFDDKVDAISKEELNTFVNKCQHDRHTFRLIISPEDARDLNLKQYTRELLDRMETDMNTKLQWVAVNHYNTDNPHTHLFIRGVNEKGNDLYIKRDYIANGIRVRAQEIATKYLGERTALDIEDQIGKDIHKERLTDLDRKMINSSVDNAEGLVDIAKTPADHQAYFQRSVMHQRLNFLNKLGLAYETEPGKWQLHSDTENILKQLGQRGDIIKTMHASMRGERSIPECVIYSKNAQDMQLEGVVTGRGLTHELQDDNYIIVRATDNRAYYIPLTSKSEREGREAEIGSLVSVTSKGNYVNVHTLSRLPVSEQIHAAGPTYLDREIAKNGLAMPADKVLSAVDMDIEKAKQERFAVLRERGLTNTPAAGKPALKYDAFNRLEAAEHDKIYSLYKDKGYAKAEIKAGQEYSGYVVKIDKLSDGTYAVIADTDHEKVAVVPYQSGMEKAMDGNKEVTITLQRERVGFEPAHIKVTHIDKTKAQAKERGLER